MTWPWRQCAAPPDEAEFLQRLETLPVGWSGLFPNPDGGAIVGERIGRHAWAFWPADFEEGGKR